MVVPHSLLPQYVYFRFLKSDHGDDWLVCQVQTMLNQILFKGPSIPDVLELFSYSPSPRHSSSSSSSFISSSSSLSPRWRKKLIGSHFLPVWDNEIYVLKQRTAVLESGLGHLGVAAFFSPFCPERAALLWVLQGDRPTASVCCVFSLPFIAKEC